MKTQFTVSQQMHGNAESNVPFYPFVLSLLAIVLFVLLR